MDLREKEEIALPGGCSPTRSNHGPACTMLVLDSFSDCVRTNIYTGFSKSSYCLASQVCLKCGVADPHFFTYKIFDRPN